MFVSTSEAIMPVVYIMDALHCLVMLITNKSDESLDVWLLPRFHWPRWLRRTWEPLPSLLSSTSRYVCDLFSAPACILDMHPASFSPRLFISLLQVSQLAGQAPIQYVPVQYLPMTAAGKPGAAVQYIPYPQQVS